jgi:Na+-transporting methylmalonyl-CoA/oxaloacetate decarboxylase gamma subunit
MTDSPTVKALFSVLLVLILIVSVTTIGEAIGQDSPTEVSAPATSPYSQVEASAQETAHNRSETAVRTSRPRHNH